MQAEIAQVVQALDEMRLSANVFGADWRLAHMTEAQRVGTGADVPVGAFAASVEFRDAFMAGGTVIPEELEGHVSRLMPYMLATHPGGRAQVLELVAPPFRAIAESAAPVDPPPMWTSVMTVRPRGFQPYPLRAVLCRINDSGGRFAGVAELWLPNLSGQLLGLITLADTAHLERLASVTSSRRRPSAILFADLEASTPLARRLSTGAYFDLIRRIMRAVDDVVVARGGLVGRHVGDGLTAYYPAELAGSEERAAKAALLTAQALGPAVAAAAATVPGAGDIRINAGVHWGATVRLGAMLTAARFEVTALGEEVNETARIEACATGGRILASKPLIERLDDETYASLDMDAEAGYVTLADVPGAPEKARRDAPTLAVRPL